MPHPEGRQPGRLIGPYSEAQLALFAQYRDKRVPYRPAKCKGSGKCWVELGPLGLSSAGLCLECRQAPRAAPQ